MNDLMASKWSSLSESMKLVNLESRLKELAEDEIVFLNEAVILKMLSSTNLRLEQFEDTTRFETVVNNIHVEDYLEKNSSPEYVLVQGIKYAECLKERLASVGRPFRVLLSRDPDSDAVTVTFYLKRPDEPYGSDDPNEYELNEVIYWDIGR